MKIIHAIEKQILEIIDLRSGLPSTGVKVKSRKDLRKEKREENKAKQNAFWMKKRVSIKYCEKICT